MLWGRYIKQTRLFCIQEGSKRWRDFVKMENFLYACISDVLRNTYPHGQKMMLNRLKAKITSLHGDKLQRVMLNNKRVQPVSGREISALWHSSDAKTTGSQNDPKYIGRLWEHLADNERHHTSI